MARTRPSWENVGSGTMPTAAPSHDTIRFALRFAERVIAILVAGWLIHQAFGLLPGERDISGPHGEAEIRVGGEQGLSVSLRRYGPSVALVALGVGLLALVFLRRASWGAENERSIYYEPAIADRRPFSAVSHNDMEELRIAVQQVRKMAPDSDAATRLSSVYGNLYSAGRLDQAQKERLKALSEKDTLTPAERREVSELRDRYQDDLAPPWQTAP
jgi:hypothetical protein